MSLGTLKVLLGLDAAEFTTGLTKAEERLKRTEQQAKKFSSTLQRDIAFGVAKAQVALAALDKAGGFLIRLGFDAINTAASFQDMSEKTGASAEALASFQTAAAVTNTSMETLANLSVKLTKGLAGTDEETKQAANAIKQLGFNVDEFKKLDPAAQFEAIGKRLNEFGDGAGKTAFAVAAMGRSGADALPFLKELGEQGKRNVILTAAQIKAADDFVDAQARATSQLKQYLQIASVQALEALTPLVKIFGELAKQILGVDSATNTLKNNNGISQWAEGLVDKIAFVADAIGGLSRLFRIAGERIDATLAQVKSFNQGDFKGIGRIQEDFDKRKADIAMEPTFRQLLAAERAQEAFDRSRAQEPGGGTARPRPQLDARRFGGGGGASAAASKAAQEAKKLLDKQLSDLDNFIKAEKRIFETRESDLARLYQNDQISIAAYFDERQAALDRNTTATVDLYDKQIKAQEAFAAAAKRRKDEPAAIDAQKQIGDIQAKIEDVLHEKRQRGLKLQDDVTQAGRDYADQVDEVRARLLDLLGTEEAAGKAALIRFDIQNRALLNRARAEGDRGTEQAISQLRTQADSQAKINVLLQDAAVIEQNLATAQAKLHLERDLGLRGELESLDLLGKSTGEAAAQLQIIADKYLAIAQADGSKVLIANAEAFKQKINELAASADVLAIKIRQTFVDTGASAIETFLNSIADGKNVLDSFKAAFTQFANDIIRQINRIAAEEIANSLFKKGGSGGDSGIFSGIVNAIVNAISGREKGGSVSGKTPYVVGERGPEIFVPQTVAAAATKQIDSIIAQRGKPAEYTDRVKAATVATNLPHLIGTKGPEIFVPKAAGIIIPNDKVAKIARALERKVASPVVRRREMSVAARTILRDEKIITRYANAPYSRRASGGAVAAHVPYIVGERGREIFVPKSANAAVQRDEAISKLSKAFQKQGHSVSAATAQATRIISERQIYIKQSASAIQQNRRVVAELVANAPRQRRAAGGSVAARTPYVVGELGPELFMPKSAGRIIKNEKAIDDLVSNKIQHRAISGPNIKYVLGGHEIFVSKLANTNIKNEKFISDLVSNTAQHSASVKNERVQNNLVSNTRNEKIINQFVSNIQRGPFAAHQTYLVGRPELGVRKSEKIIKNENRVSELVTNNVKRNEKIINDLVANSVRRRESADLAHQTYFVVEHGREIFVPKSARKVIADDKAATRVRSPLLERRHDDLVSNILLPRRVGSVAANVLSERGHEISKLVSTNIKNEKFITDLVSNTVQRRAISLIKNDLVSNTVQRNEKTINQLVSNIQRRTELESYGQKDHRADNSGQKFAQHLAKTLIRGVRPRHEGPFAAHQTYLIGERAPEIFVPKSASKVIKSKKIVDDLVSSVQRRAIGSPVAAHQTYLVGGELRPELFMPKFASKIIKNEILQNDLVSNEKTINKLVSNIQRRPLASSQTYLVDEFVPKSASKVIKNEKVIYDLVTNTIQHKAQGGPVQARQTYILGERGPELFVTRSAEKIIKNESRVSELVTNNARRNEKVINDLVSKTVHHKQSAGSVAAPNVADKIIKNESRINKLISNDVQRNEEIINRLVTTTRREGGRSNELLIVGAHGPELFIPKAAGRIIKNERRINELVSNIEHRNIDRHSEKTIDEIIASTVQRRVQRGPVGTYQKYRERVAEAPKAAGRIIKSEALRDKAVKRKERVIADIVGPNIQRRASGGPVSAYQQYLVGERGPEIYMPRDTGGIKVPSDFFTNKQHHRVHGGAVAANQPYLVGERGAEAFVPKAAGRIVRNDDIGRHGGSTVEQTINFILPNQITSQTQNQIASRTLFAARRAVARGVA